MPAYIAASAKSACSMLFSATIASGAVAEAGERNRLAAMVRT